MIQTFERRRRRPLSVHSKLLNRRIWIRPHTSDVQVLGKVLGAQDYAIRGNLDKPRVIVDAGANIGLSPLYFSWKYPSATVFAIEPEESNLELLHRNCADSPSVRIMPCALWSKRTKLSIACPDGAQWHKWAFSVGEVGGEKKVESVTVSDILETAGCEYIDILKLDIEGAEKELFSEGWEQWLPRVRLIMIELHDRLVPGCSRSFYSAIINRPFEQDLKGENVIVRFKNPG